nr:ImmA/IrrE family metallo-endopeptidase [Kibdelosporangium sp. MJ126-NF4]CEL19365.1 Cinorf13 protein [Kibdelosporangium sp. MJ126-NF4]CTQ94836.1 Cinorf13 protein [Kibdelosporangium sp. MJ126-NF4]
MTDDSRPGRARRLMRKVTGRTGEQADQPPPRPGEPIVDIEQVRAVVDALPLPDPFDVRELCELVARQRGRAIKVLPYPQRVVTEARRMREPLPYGMWLPGERADYIYYREDTSLAHQQHVILHELGHLCCRHYDDTFDDESIESFHEAGRTVEGGLKRTVYSDDQERAAEMFAYLVEERLGPVRVDAGERDVDPAYAPVVDRYRTTLEQ